MPKNRDNTYTIKSLKNQASQAFSQTDWEEAIRSGEAWLSLECERHDKSNTVAHIYNFVANAYWKTGDMDTAIRYFLHSLQIAKERCNSSLQATTLCNIAFIYKERGRNRQALKLLEKAVVLREAAEPGTLALANLYSTIASLLKDEKRYLECLAREKQSLRIKEQILPGTELLAQSYMATGQLYLIKALAHPSKALQYFQRAERIIEKLSEPTALEIDLVLKKDNAMTLENVMTRGRSPSPPPVLTRMTRIKAGRTTATSKRPQLVRLVSI